MEPGRASDGRFGKCAADNPRHEIARRGLADCAGCYLPAVPEHRHAVRDAEDFIQPVCDIKKPDTTGPEPLQLVEQQIDIAGRQRGSRLVEDEKITAKGKRSSDRYDRFFRRRQCADLRIRR